MDLDIKGRKALVTASSRGLGKACAIALAKEGVQVTLNGLNATNLQVAAEEVRRNGGIVVNTVVADINTQLGRLKLIEACSEPDILVNNNWGPPPGRWQDFGYEDWMQAVEANMIAPIMLIKAVVGGMQQRKFGRIVNITSQMVKSPFAVMGLSAAARTGLTAACKALSRETAQYNVTINNLLPERIDTERTRYMAQRQADASGISYDEARRDIVESIAAKRLGKPEELGAACAFLCSEAASYISGQNLQLDGGSYRGTF